MHNPGSIQFREELKAQELVYLKKYQSTLPKKENYMNWLALLEELVPLLGGVVTKYLPTTKSKQIAGVATVVATSVVTALAANSKSATAAPGAVTPTATA